MIAVASVLPAEAQATQCCFNNPRFAGTCSEFPAEGETCAGILAYLNSLSSVGRGYCGMTDVRGGWRQVDCGQAQVGGAGGEPGSGERLASRLVAALVEQHAQRRMAGLLKKVDEQRASLEENARKCLVEALSEADLETLGEALRPTGGGRAKIAELGERLEALGLGDVADGLERVGKLG